MKYFKEGEFTCKCGKCGKGFKDMNPELLDKLDKARGIANIPFKLTSAFRCPSHNKTVGGVPDSAHLTGKAVDIATPDNATRFTIMAALLDAGFQRIGINLTTNFLHCDVDMDKPHPTMFKY